MAGPKTLQPGQYLFREGDPSDACYVVKTGKIVITKAKGNSEIELAELRAGQMFGEMAFFDNKPRSASAKAKTEAVVVTLPFVALNAQFKAMPEWLKAMVKTINDHLRDANTRIKNLESANPQDATEFTPYRITKLCAILGLVGSRFAEKNAEGHFEINYQTLRNYCIQVFQEPTNKMDKIMSILQGLGFLKVEDLGEGRKKVTFMELDRLVKFVDFYNTWLFKEESKRINVEKKDMRNLRALAFYGRKETPNDKGVVKVNLTAIQNESMKDLGYVLTVNDWESVISKKIVGDKISESGSVAITFSMKDIEDYLKNWEVVYAIEDAGGK